MLIFYKQQSYSSQIVTKKAKITTFFFMKNSNNIILVLVLFIWFQFIHQIEHKRWICWHLFLFQDMYLVNFNPKEYHSGLVSFKAKINIFSHF